MVAAKYLPLYVKRLPKLFLISFFGYLLSSFTMPDNPPDDIKNSIRTIVIDAGHGGKDSGAVGKRAQEKDIALNIALKLGKYVEDNYEDVNVVYTRKKDVFVPLYERASIANKNEADLFISIHVNANQKISPTGTSSHVLGLHRTNEHFETAVRENSVILLEEDYETTYQGFDPGSLESYIIFSVMQNTYLKQSIEFASYIQDQLRERAKRKDRGVVQQGLLVLAQTSMPAVLIETGFISNPEEEKYLLTEYGQDIIASAIYRAFKQYKTRIEENSNFTVNTPAAEPETETETDTLTLTDEAAEVTQPSIDKLVFLVQIASSKSLVSTEPASFKGYKGVRVFEKGRWYKYTVGENMTYHEALEACKQIQEDFPGAFVIAVKNDEIISMSEAIMEINQ
ncbi:N-acetylmuramoyl-L-alanine amidase [Bacteroidota bacterium]